MTPLAWFMLASCLIGIAVYFFFCQFDRVHRIEEYHLFTSLGYNVGNNEEKPDFFLALLIYRNAVNLHFNDSDEAYQEEYNKIWDRFTQTWIDLVLMNRSRPSLKVVVNNAIRQLGKEERWMSTSLILIGEIITKHFGDGQTSVIL